MPTPTTTAFASFISSSLLAALAALAACGDDPQPPAPDPLFPADYATTFQEVRDCRNSIEHDLVYVRILADPTARQPYLDRTDPFPVGSTILKEEYSDPDCSDLTGFAAIRREEPGFDPDGGDWHWQRANASREVLEDGLLGRCSSCHAVCGVPPEGFDGTCTVP